jgi:hypothetical protein
LDSLAAAVAATTLPLAAAFRQYVAKCFGSDFVIDTKDFADVKRKAILEYKTQLPGLEHLFLKEGSTGLTLNQEVFRLAWGPRPEHLSASDLFEGLS